MNKQKWQQIKKIFEKAIIIESDDERKAFIDLQANDDSDIIEQVSKMVAAEMSEKTSSNILGQEANDFVNAQWEFISGDRVGAFVIQEKIAEGGMGAVFSGERADGTYQQKVAIKAIRPNILNQNTLQRFNTERQILANFSHPNIASLIDGGTSDKGLPFYVMEYIDGLPLLDYVRQNQLNLSQKLVLFQKICLAVEYAHQHLVVHRDIKTSNVLIKQDGELKLLDFGIAKIMDTEQPELSITRVDQQVLTPENASPEQVRGEAITTATDIYMLGVLLYQLLTDNKPFNFKTNSIFEVEKLVCQTSPLKPSQNISGSANLNLVKQLKGDLDNVILKAMAKQPQERYQSAGQFSDDISRYLNHVPVQAKRGHWLDISKKFIRRNRLVVSLYTAVTTLIIAFSIFISLQAIQLTKEKDRALVAEEKAIQKSLVAKQASDFMVSLFSTADPRGKGSQFTTAKDLLDNALEKLTAEKIEDKKVRIELLLNIALAYRNLTFRQKSYAPFEEALKLATEVFGDSSLEVAEIKVRLGDAYRENHHDQRAYELLKSALEIMSKYKQPASYEIADGYNNLAWVVYNLGRVDEAIAMQQKSVSLHKLYAGEQGEELAIPYNNLAILYRRVGQYSKAIEYAQKSLDINKIIVGRNDNIASSLMGLGRLNRSIGNYDEAMTLFKESKRLRASKYGKTHWRATMLDRDIALTFRKMGHVKKGELLLRTLEADLLKEENYSDTSYGVWEFYLALFLKDQGKTVEAERRMSHSISLQIKRTGEDFPRILRYQRDLAELYMINGKLQLAENLLNRVLLKRQLNSSSNNLQIGLLHYSFIKLFHAKGEFEQQKESELKALKYFESIDPKAEENQLLKKRIKALIKI